MLSLEATQINQSSKSRSSQFQTETPFESFQERESEKLSSQSLLALESSRDLLTLTAPLTIPDKSLMFYQIEQAPISPESSHFGMMEMKTY